MQLHRALRTTHFVVRGSRKRGRLALMGCVESDWEREEDKITCGNMTLCLWDQQKAESPRTTEAKPNLQLCGVKLQLSI